MTTQEMIETYIPRPPDPTLGEDEYYYLQSTAGGERVIRVVIRQILPYEEGTEYGIYQDGGRKYKRVDVGYGDSYRGARMSQLYDNKQDCKEQTHYTFDRWEELRRVQMH